MPANAQVYQTTTITNATIVTTAETIVATLTGVAGDPYGRIVRISGMVSLTADADAIGVSFKAYINSASGAQILPENLYSLLGGSTIPLGVSFVGALPIGVHSIVITAAMDSATGNSTVNAVAITATVGN